MRRPKLSVDEQIKHMKDKGIQFNLVSEEDAKLFLCNNTYYFKIKAYAKNYEKYQYTEKVGQYINLEFAYLKELSVIDMHLRHFIIKMSLDLEHAIKTKLLNDFNESDEDGYNIIKKLFEENPDVWENIQKKKGNSVCTDLIIKLIEEDFAIWNIIEILSFGDFIKLYKLFYREYPNEKPGENLSYPLMSVKSIRNAAAHSNCLLNTLRKPYTGEVIENRKISTFVSQIKDIDSMSRKHNMSNQVIHDFVTMLYAFDKVVMSEGIKSHILEELNDLVNVRMVKNKEYFTKNNSIVSSYEFIKKVVDYLIAKSI